MSKSTRRAGAVVLAFGAALALTGCNEADVAATVDGQVISEDAAREAAAQIRANFEGAEQFGTADAVSGLINAPFIIAAADKAGAPFSEQAARAQLTKVADPTQETVELVRSNFAYAQLQQSNPDAINDIVAGLQGAKIKVNPRYGRFDRAQVAVTPLAPNWIADSVSGDPLPEGHTQDDGHNHG